MNFYDANGGQLGSKEITQYTHVPIALSCLQVHGTARRAERSQKASSRLQMASSVDGGLSIGRTLQAVGAPPDAFRGIPDDNFRFTVAHADRGLFEARK